MLYSWFPGKLPSQQQQLLHSPHLYPKLKFHIENLRIKKKKNVYKRGKLKPVISSSVLHFFRRTMNLNPSNKWSILILKLFRGPSRVFFFFSDEKYTYTFLNALWFLPQLRIQNQKTKIPLYRIITLKKKCPHSNVKCFNIYYIPIDSSNAKRTSFPLSRRSFILLPIHLKPGNVSWNAEEATLVKWLSHNTY